MEKTLSTAGKVLRIIGVVIIVFAIFVAFFSVVVWFGVNHGEVERVERHVATINADVAINYELAQESFSEKNYVLAQRAIERALEGMPYVTEGDVSQKDVEKLYAEITNRQDITPIPISTVKLPPANIVREPLVETSISDEALNKEKFVEVIQLAERLVDDRDYEKAIEAVVAFQLINPNYERYRTDSLLFDAYINLAFQLTSGNEVSRGISYFELAKRLGTLPDAARNQLNISEIYLQGLAYRGIRWPIAIKNFVYLCTYAINFHDPCTLLHDAYVAYAVDLLQTDQPCLALEQYQFAYEQSADKELNPPIARAKIDCEKMKAAIPVKTLRPGQGRWTPTPRVDN